MKKLEDMTKEEQIALEEAAIKNQENFGKPKDLFHPNYGWILLDYKITEAGIQFFKDHFPGN